MGRKILGALGLILGVGLIAFFLFYRTDTARLPTGEFAGVSLRIEYATSTEAREKGLGGREVIPDDYGLLFVFSEDDRYGFWMKGMLVPIDIFWLDDKGHVVSVARDVATSTYPDVFYPNVPARYVLETVAGFARAHRVEVGMPLLLKNFPGVSE